MSHDNKSTNGPAKITLGDLHQLEMETFHVEEMDQLDMDAASLSLWSGIISAPLLWWNKRERKSK